VGAPTIVRERFRGWEDTYRVTNGLVEARVVADVGPRIVELRRAGGENLFHLRDDELGGRDEPVWRFRGGWRLWVAPERRATTYALDNVRCEVTRPDAASLRVVGPPQPEAGIRKEVRVAIDAAAPCVRVESRVTSVAAAPVVYAPWSLAVLRAGGRAFLPLDVGPPEAFDSIRRVILWSYARVADPRYRFGDRLVEIAHDRVVDAYPCVRADDGGGEAAGDRAPRRRADESKIGVDSVAGWAAYLIGDTLFVTRAVVEAGPRPDGGATLEAYSSREFIELEHLGVLATLSPGDAAVLREQWWVLAGVTLPAPGAPDGEVRAALEAHLDGAGARSNAVAASA
jgi:hypothetical protein